MSPHKPLRTCIVCGEKKVKQELLRIVRTPHQGIEIDQAANKPGRGAYLCYDRNCFETAIKKNKIQRNLKVSEPAGFLENLIELLNDRN